MEKEGVVDIQDDSISSLKQGFLFQMRIFFFLTDPYF
jgi:hypothetical protein